MESQSTHADMTLKKKFTLVQTHSYTYPLKRTFSFHRKPMAHCQPLHVFTMRQSFSGHPLADAVNSSPLFHSTPSAVMGHCMFVVRVGEKGGVAEGECTEA